MKPFRYKKQLIIGLAICFVVAAVALLNSHRANKPTSPTNAPVATSQQPADHTGGEQASDSTTQPQTSQADASPQQQDAPSPTNNDVTEITNTTSSDVEPTQDTSQASQSADYDFATELDEVTKKATEQASPFVIPDGVEYEPHYQRNRHGIQEYEPFKPHAFRKRVKHYVYEGGYEPHAHYGHHGYDLSVGVYA